MDTESSANPARSWRTSPLSLGDVKEGALRNMPAAFFRRTKIAPTQFQPQETSGRQPSTKTHVQLRASHGVGSMEPPQRVTALVHWTGMWPDPDVAAAAADTPDSKQSPDDDICVFACWPTSQDETRRLAP
ncbi:hypothetical protein PCL_00712 [Purpureocillium lilacinum]|uniref:Uncharacterized protein n=1 Tax=Purpureocillium lilacinum TaxID=33203 RepID=A0A2U3E5K6_PURLI|nr:hypothetical protein PCL_00712 [Purpureocillium lilacinum]